MSHGLSSSEEVKANCALLNIEMKNFMLAVLIICFVFTIVLLWLNRDSEKVLTALIVVFTTSLATGVGALVVSLKSEKVTEKFMVAFVYDKLENRPILSKTHALNKRYGGCGTIWAFSDQKLIEETSENLNELLIDFLARCTLETWIKFFQSSEGKLPEFQTYDWAPRHTHTMPYYLEESKGFLNRRITYNSIVQLLKERGNVFSDRVGAFKDFSLILPSDTSFSYSSENLYRKIHLHNSFFDYVINIKHIGGTTLTEDYYNVVKMDKSNSERYKLVSFAFNTEADFSGWRSGYPEMKFYKYWINSLNLLFRKEFDWKSCLEEIKNEWIEESFKKK